MGVIYFKLTSPLYDGDSTKNASLTGAEVDGNFNFLRGYDIKNIGIDSETNKIFIERLNGEILTSISGININDYTFTFNPENGVMFIKYPNGETKTVSGFTMSSMIYKDDSLNGDGTKANPLKVSSAYKTGTYSPVVEFVTTLPTNPAKGYRAITREKYGNFGRLYTYNEAVAINNALTGTAWRLPSKEDWDKMLNSIEICEEGKNHDAMTHDAYLGKDAGKLLKANNSIWEGNNGNDTYGFGIMPVGYMKGEDFGGFGTEDSYWTSTRTLENEGSEVYVKSFRTGDTVYQSTPGCNDINSFSIRLVKDFNNDFSSTEEILGMTVPCIYMASSKQVWTRVNVSFKNLEGSAQEIGRIPSYWQQQEEFKENYVYFINEWNGFGWEIKVMNEGDSVVIGAIDLQTGTTYQYEDEKVHWHEWRVVKNQDGEYMLMDLITIVQEEVWEAINALNIKVNNEITARTQEIARLETIISGMNQTIVNLNNRITELENTFDSRMVQIIKDKLIGTDHEIIITDTTDGKRKIGFDRNKGTFFEAEME